MAIGCVSHAVWRLGEKAEEVSAGGKKPLNSVFYEEGRAYFACLCNPAF